MLKPLVAWAVTSKVPNLFGAFTVQLPSASTVVLVVLPSIVTATVVPAGAPATVPVTSVERNIGSVVVTLGAFSAIFTV